ncbi:MAG: hypothetical protein L0228_11320 [Planctomycetes bacterium]|nr:hypothetical protein [Planctomycetota bacterium]
MKLFSQCCGSGCGCSEEVYWSEWHNDPPRCCDPCDCHGNWIGPSAGSYRAPNAHAYSPSGYPGGTYVATGGSPVGYAKTNAANRQQTARQAAPARPKTQAARSRGAAAIEFRR